VLGINVITGEKQPKSKIDFDTILNHTQLLLWFDKIVDIVVILIDDVTTVKGTLVVDGISSVLVIIDDCFSINVDCSIQIYSFIFWCLIKLKIDKPSGSCVSVWLSDVWTISVVVVSIKAEILLITNSL